MALTDYYDDMPVVDIRLTDGKVGFSVLGKKGTDEEMMVTFKNLEVAHWYQKVMPDERQYQPTPLPWETFVEVLKEAPYEFIFIMDKAEGGLIRPRKVKRQELIDAWKKSREIKDGWHRTKM